MTNNRGKAYRAGILAEYAAILYLFFKGYRILHYRYKCKTGEIDILAQKKSLLVAIEVKFRQRIDEALQSVHNKNQVRIENALRHFLSQNPEFSGHDMRFDVIAMGRLFSFRHLDNVFHARS